MTDQSSRPNNTRHDLIDRLRGELDQMAWRNLRRAEDMLRPYGLTFPQLLVLSFLKRLGPDLEMSRIASLSGLPASTITSIMDRLVKRDLAERTPGTTDRRIVTGSITQQGSDVLALMESHRDQAITEILEDFSKDEILTILKLIDRYVSHTKNNV